LPLNGPEFFLLKTQNKVIRAMDFFGSTIRDE
jgi:hypothetical protein